MIATCYTEANDLRFDRMIVIPVNDWYFPPPPERETLKARRARFQDYTRSLGKDAGFTGIRAAGKQWKPGRRARARAREQRTKRNR